MVNISELLKDAPKGMKLYSPLFGEVEFLAVDSADSTIIVRTERETHEWFSACGRYKVMKSHLMYSDAECLLFPSKECRTWEEWKVNTCKFKVLDWIVRNNGSSDIPIQVYGLKKDRYLVTNMLGSKGELMINRQDEWHLWTIQDAIDGDVLACSDWLFILKQFNVKGNKHKTYCHYDLTLNRFKDDTDSYMVTGSDEFHPANKVERDMLFAKMREAGYEWDADKKELRKIKSRYDIANFYTGMPVLVRDEDNRKWCYLLYSHYDNTYEDGLSFNAGSVEWRQCIPYNEETMHLLGTTDMPSEEYINW